MGTSETLYVLGILITLMLSVSSGWMERVGWFGGICALVTCLLWPVFVPVFAILTYIGWSEHRREMGAIKLKKSVATKVADVSSAQRVWRIREGNE